MGTKDARIDAYIAKSAAFARPMLDHLRELVHRGCPEIAETMKWSMPHFEYKGVVCSMAAFKEHCSFGFWKGELFLPEEKEGAMGSFGRLKSLDDLPADRVLLKYIKEAARLNEAGIKRPVAPRPKEKKELVIPGELTAALKKAPRARQEFDKFSYSHKKEYVEWITEAKTEPTRLRRLETAIDWMANGKSRHWKNKNC